jgi:hypothetical protein
MLKDRRLTPTEQAAYNNAVWCDTVCRTHSTPGEFQSQIWLNRSSTPPYYPNAVTLSNEASHTAQINAIQSLIAARGLSGFAVKDSFNALDLTSFGFEPLFEARWLWRSPSVAPPSADIPEIHWCIIQQPDELIEWENAWAGRPSTAQLALEAHIFRPSLLVNQAIVFVAAYRDHQIVAGAIGNRTGNVVGISNQFSPSDDSSSYWAGCIATIMAAYPDHPMVGYEHGAVLPIVQALGFQEIGPLRVWARPDQSAQI